MSALYRLARKKTWITLLKIWAKPKKKRTTEQTSKTSKVVDFFGHIRDSTVIENMRAFISYYVIVNKTAFMTVHT